MKILLLAGILFFGLPLKNKAASHDDADAVLQKLATKLAHAKNIRYHQLRELNYASENYHNKSAWSLFLDFESTDTVAGFKFQVDDSNYKSIFNGTEVFDLDKKQKSLKINEQPAHGAFNSNSAFYNSVLTLKNSLPLIIADKTKMRTVSDTLFNQISCYVVTLYLGKNRIQNLGNGFDAMTTKSNFIYKIIIDKKADLPIAVLQMNDLDDDFIRTEFSEIALDDIAPPELSWYYSTYAGEYKRLVEKDGVKMIQSGEDAPVWSLPQYDTKETTRLEKLKGKVILLDFWIKNCGPCIKSIPDLNALQQKFNNKNFELIGINAYDSQEEIKWFCDRHQPKYRILMQGKLVAEKYGVNAFPIVVLIDKTGKVLYAGGFEQNAIEKMIEKSL